MPWCPNCKSEYREGFRICTDCKVELVQELEPEETEFQHKQEEWVFLINVLGEHEKNVVESLLKSHDIPLLKKHKGSGEYIRILTGNSNFGIDLFVPESKLETAKEIINCS
ncbi:MAG: hypothetical protein CVU88_04145 [Firmicutes bacterium HGW-Firmicutes-13]|nr:MAG: hypothetical protein CVU88_04145 [Firmicutes bacterium HGW-Firmicutes-13]